MRGNRGGADSGALTCVLACTCVCADGLVSTESRETERFSRPRGTRGERRADLGGEEEGELAGVLLGERELAGELLGEREPEEGEFETRDD